jgi:hypothetical protein
MTKHVSGKGLRASRQKLCSRLSSHNAETISKWITTKCDGRACPAFEFLLAFRASIHCLGQEGIEIVDVKVNVNWRPVSIVSTNVVSSFCRFGSR